MQCGRDENKAQVPLSERNADHVSKDAHWPCGHVPDLHNDKQGVPYYSKADSPSHFLTSNLMTCSVPTASWGSSFSWSSYFVLLISQQFLSLSEFLSK